MPDLGSLRISVRNNGPLLYQSMASMQLYSCDCAEHPSSPHNLVRAPLSSSQDLLTSDYHRDRNTIDDSVISADIGFPAPHRSINRHNSHHSPEFFLYRTSPCRPGMRVLSVRTLGEKYELASSCAPPDTSSVCLTFFLVQSFIRNFNPGHVCSNKKSAINEQESQ